MTTDPQWSPCEPGTLDSLQETHSSRITRRGVLTAAVTASVTGGVLLLQGRSAGGISCARVVELAPDYVAGVLSAELSQQIDTHRQKCGSCDARLRQLAKQQQLDG